MSKYDTGEMAGACHSCYVISALCALLSYILCVTCSQQIGETAQTTWYHDVIVSVLSHEKPNRKCDISDSQ